MASRNRKRFESPAGFEHGIAYNAQELASQFAHARFVLDHENRLAASRNRGRFFVTLGICCLARGMRKINFKFRADTGRSVHPNEASTLLHHSIDGSQPQSSSFPDFLCGEERLKNAGFGGLVHAMPR